MAKANMTEEQAAVLKAVKSVALEFGEALKNRQWEEAFEISGRLNPLLKSEEMKEFSEKDLELEGVTVVKENLKKYFYWSGQLRKAEGALVAKGNNILDGLK